MFVVFLQYAIYQNGDENLNLSNLNVSTQEIKPIFKKIDVYPNPINENYIHIQNNTLNNSNIQLLI